jgi:tryptophan 2,3-dioxygenase
MVEAMLGLRLENRHGRDYYLSQLRPEHVELIKSVEEQRSLIEEVNSWLERMPFLDDMNLWGSYKGTKGSFWDDYRECYRQSLVSGEQENIDRFNSVFFDEEFAKTRRFSPKANRSALFIMLYRDYPLLQMPYRLLNHLLDIDELMAQWRYRHMNMVHRMIGTRIGTGGSSGKEYLKAALDKHYIYQELAELTSFLIERRNLPVLPGELVKHVGFYH